MHGSYPAESAFPWEWAIASWIIMNGAPLLLESGQSAHDLIGASIESRHGFPLLGVPFSRKVASRGAFVAHFRALPGGISHLVVALQRVALEMENLENESEREGTAPVGTGEKPLLTGILEAQDWEREQMGMELHDGMLQKMVVALQYLRSSHNPGYAENSSPDLSRRAVNLLEEAITETRELISQGQPKGLAEQGLAGFLRNEFKRLEERTGVEIQLVASNFPAPDATAKALVRIALEGVQNSLKHSQTKRILVELVRDGQAIGLEVRDWGQGFDPEALVFQTGRHFGIANIRRRAELLGGTCQIVSRPSQGTRVIVSIPYS